MLIITNKDCDTVDKLLKKYKKKFDRTQVVKSLRSRSAFVKPSIVRRKQVLKAVYIRETYYSQNS
jgi:small subunit ribosomal protein S21